jgi:serine/threonine protein kinase/tetratricopeptide (TPR) repeat protein
MKNARLSDIFDSALQKRSDAERAAFLEGACGSDADLRGRVETLLRAHDAADGFLQSRVDVEPPQVGPGTVIGRYKLLQQIGEGGFGVVYMAEQIEPVRRKVALKIIKLGMDTRQVVARFESERQALALMDHLHIARVFDAGATDTGRPYFVMELVKGIAITEYADKNELSMRDRLELFITVCQAVQHAHQKGIIHRDIKPTNVLVTLHDGRPITKVIDFGIAKATSMRLTEKTVFTEFRQIVGTPQYMSPEQAEMSGLDVDTRCDIYSLGVLLYELLTGTTPIDAEWLRSVGYIEMQRIIRDEDPPPPSLRVSTLHEQLETVAKHRRVEPRSLSRVVRGDLDWIVMKALEKDRTRRYATAGDLAADVERYLRHEPVEAGPPNTIYRFQKFVRRNRTAVLAGFLVSVALLAGLGMMAAGFVSANREARHSQAIAEFLEDIVVAVNPQESAGQQLDVEQVVRRARELFGRDHATVAAALDCLATRSQQTGDIAAAEQLFRESSRIWRIYGSQSPNLALSLGHLGSLLRSKGDDTGAEAALRESLGISAAFPDDRQLPFCETRTELATILQRTGHLEEAGDLVRESLRIHRLQPKLQRYQVAKSLELLTQILVSQNRHDEAEQTLTEAITLLRGLVAADSPMAAYYSFALGHSLRQYGHPEKAEPHLREAVRIYRQMEHPPQDYYLMALDGLFQQVRKRDESFDEALALFHECMHAMARMVGPDHPSLGGHFLGYGQMLGEKNRAVEAIPLLVEGLRIFRSSKGNSWNPGPFTEMLEHNVSLLVSSADRPRADYDAALTGAVALLESKPEESHYRHLHGMVLYRLGRPAEALSDLTVPVNGRESANRDQMLQQLAVLALAQFQSGDTHEAGAGLMEMRELLKDKRESLTKETLSLTAEAERVVAAEERTEKGEERTEKGE